MQPQPQNIALDIAELLSKMQLIMLEGKPNSDVDLARLDDLIKKIESASPVEAMSFRGGYYCLRGNQEEAMRCHQAAIKMAPRATYLYVYYGITLLDFSEYEKATEQFLKALKLNSGDVDALDYLLKTAYYGSLDALLEEWLPHYKKLTGKPHLVEEWLLEDAEDEAGLDDIIAEGKEKGLIPLEDTKKELGL